MRNRNLKDLFEIEDVTGNGLVQASIFRRIMADNKLLYEEPEKIMILTKGY